MILGINARILDHDSVRGWSRYAYNLIRGLSSRNIEIKFFSDRPIHLKWIPKDRHKDIHIEVSSKYILWEQVVLKRLAERHGVSILHCPINYGLPYFGNFKKVLTLHDAIEKSYYGQFVSKKDVLLGAYLKNTLLHKISQKSADKIITVSEFAKKDIVENYKIEPSKISVIYEAADESIKVENVKEESAFIGKWKIDPGYLFYIGGLEQRKNIPFILELARKQPQQQFVVAGGGENPFKNHAPMNVRFIGYVPDEWLSSFYFYSKAFLYPSFQEGFGLQIVESIKLGKPALYANNSSLQEVYGSSEFGFDPNNVDQALEKLRLLNVNYSQAVDFVRSRNQFFSWDKAIDQTLEVYRSL